MTMHAVNPENPPEVCKSLHTARLARMMLLVTLHMGGLQPCGGSNKPLVP